MNWTPPVPPGTPRTGSCTPGREVRHRGARRAGRRVRTFSVESVTDRARLDRLAGEAGVVCACLVRLNGPAGSVSGSLRMTGGASPFGVDVADTAAVRSLLTPRDHTHPVGLHTYFATNVADEDGLLAEFDQAVRTSAAVCRDTGFVPRVLDLGGGFAAPQAVPGELGRHPGWTRLSRAPSRPTSPAVRRAVSSSPSSPDAIWWPRPGPS
ncbi:hypothetical protein NKH77_53445 [Streptomyces sp. M19]